MSKAKPDVVSTVKDLLADPKDRIKLDDLVVELLRKTAEALSSDAFAMSGEQLNAETFQTRLRRYEEASGDLLKAAILIARWGSSDQLSLLGRIVSRLAALNRNPNGLVAWTSLRWYPLFLIIHAAGIAALFGDSPAALKPLLLTPVTDELRGDARQPVAARIASQMNEIMDTFRLLPQHAKHRVPRSEYVFDVLKASLDELLYLGDDYERLYDDFEILNALVCGDFWQMEHSRVWAAPGRFGYKFPHSGQPFDGFVVEATAAGPDWPLLKLGFFKSSADRVREVAKGYRDLLTELHWH